MPAAHTTIERIALGRAASAYISFTNRKFVKDHFAGYLAFKTAVDTFSNPSGMTVTPELENDHEIALSLIEHLAERITQGIKDALQLAKDGIIHEIIEGRLHSDMSVADMPELVEVGSRLESNPDADSPSEEDEPPAVLRRFKVSVTRTATSPTKLVTVLATSDEEAESLASDKAGDMDFSGAVDAEYDCSASKRFAYPLVPGDVLIWRDPANGEEQDVIYRETHGEIVLCHTLGGGEVEVFAQELR